ncbi:MAG: response regulator transcription factor [Breznakibacter sp.]
MISRAKKRIIIADDHAVVRMGMQLMLDETSDMAICDEASNGHVLMHKLSATEFDLVVMDASMPGRDGIDLLKEVKSLYPKLPVVVFTMNHDDHFAIRMIKAGASAFVSKETNPQHIIEALRVALTGKRYFFPHQADILAEMVNAPHTNRDPHEALTDREFQVMYLLASGLKTHEIAEKIMVSKHTVANHRTAILKKMGLAGNAELAKYAVKHQIVK